MGVAELSLKKIKNKKTGKEEIDFVKKIDKWELERFKSFSYQEQGLLNLLDYIQRGRKDFWNIINKKYNLDGKKGYRIERKTREILEV